MSDKGLRVRSFRSGDHETIKKLFVTGLAEPAPSAFVHVLNHPIPIAIWGAGCAVAAGGLALLTKQNPPPTRYIVAVTSIWSAAVVTWLHKISVGSFHSFIKWSLTQDMGNIPEYYELEAIDESNKYDIAYAPRGRKNFFVCEDNAGAIAGFVALDYHPELPKRTGELRRMVVAPTHRRQGVAELLIKVLITHAKKNDIQVIELGTSDVQYGAKKLYQKMGWREHHRVFDELQFIDVIKYHLDLENIV
ncbi:acyl-CoA N-acyltransferase [Umbelopsis sp. PMI_123]|jgi:GNAT superfamily N-acetyltransferase|nr:acyl-CoA N-acyltransferase [Umbelopsis sp. PMI_123]